MVDPPDSLQEIIRQRQQAGFVGREAQLAFFRDNLALPVDDAGRRFLFAIHGDGGIGKTFLVGRLGKTAVERGWLTAVTDHSSYDVVEVMAAIAGELERQGARLKRFEQRYSTFVKRKNELGSGVPAAEDAASLVTQTAVRVGLGMARSLPLGGVVTEFIDPRAAAQGTDQFRAAIAKQVRSRADARLLLSPVEELTPAFVEGLRQLSRPVALFFDTYEMTSVFLDGWLRGLFDGVYGQLPVNLVITVAGRVPLDASRWSAYLGLVADVPLVPFTAVEVRQLLAQHGVIDEHMIAVILKASGGLPLAVAMLAESRPVGDWAPADVSAGVVERFLQWEDNPRRREIALSAALPRRLDEDVVGVLADSADVSALYDWLARQPFVTSGEGRCHYHDVVRRPMIRLNRGRSPQRWRELHGRLSKANRQWREQLGYGDEEGWSDPGWHGYLLEETYHRLCADPPGSIPDALSGAVEACAYGTTLVRKWAEMVAQAGDDADAAAVGALGKRLEDALSAEEDTDISFLDAILDERLLSTASRATAYRMRGREHRIAGRYEQALVDFGRAWRLQPQYAAVFAGRGETYRLMGRYEEALADFGRAIELDPEDDWAIASRGQTYQALGRFDEALADLSHAIELDPKVDWAIVSRGQTYQALGRFDEAFADQTRAIELDPDNAWAVAWRGETYRLMGRYEEALADFNCAIEIVGEVDWVIAWRGVTYSVMGRFEQAVADLTRAIELDPEYDWAIAWRGRTCRLMGRYEDALADLSRAIELDPEYAWAIAWRGETYRLMGRYEDALADLTRAIELDPEDDWAIANRGVTYLRMERYEEALADLTRAIELDPEYDWAIAWRGRTNRLMGRYEDALADLSRAIEIDPENAWVVAERGRTHRTAGHQAEAEADLNRAVALDPQDDDYQMERAMTRGIAHEGKDQFQCIVDVEATLDDSTRLAHMITDWLISTGIMESEEVSGKPGGHRPGRSWDTAVVGSFPSDDSGLPSPLRRIRIVSGRLFVHPLTLRAITCPSCGTRIEMHEKGHLAATWDRVMDAAARWQAEGTGFLRCPRCWNDAHLRDWHFDPAWAFGRLGIAFLNWPPLAESFISDVSSKLAHPVVVITGKL